MKNISIYLLGVFTSILIYFGGYYYDVFYEPSTFNFDSPTPVKCQGWQNKWKNMVGAGNSWRCPKTSREEYNKWCDWEKSLNWEGESKPKLNLFFYKISCSNLH